MNNYEQEIYNLFLEKIMVNYFEALRNKNTVDFDMEIHVSENHIPFNVYNDMLTCIINQMNNSPEAPQMLSTIIIDAFLYTNSHNDPFFRKVKQLIETSSLEDISYFLNDNILYGTAIIKAFLNYLLLIAEDISYKDILVEDAKKYDKTNVLKRFEVPNCTITTRSHLLKKVLLDIYDYYFNKEQSEASVFNAFDKYFFNNELPSSVFELNKEFLEDAKVFSLNQIEQMRIIYENAFIAIKSGNCDAKEVEIFLDVLTNKGNDFRLPAQKDLRWQLYTLFMDECKWYNPKEDLTKLNSEHKLVLKKIYPSYFLDSLFD